MSSIIEQANLALRFTLELGIVAAAACWAWRTIHPAWLGLTAALAIAAAIAALWASVVHGATVPPAVQLMTQVALFGLAVAALAHLGHRKLAGAFGSVALLNAALMLALTP